MTAPALRLLGTCDRAGLKGPWAAEWLRSQGVPIPAQPNTWAQADTDAMLVARLGAGEFFLEDPPSAQLAPSVQRASAVQAAPAAQLAPSAQRVRRISAAMNAGPPGVYPVLREDWGFLLSGARVHEVLAQICNVNFADLSLDARPVIMTLMMGIAVLVVPQAAGRERRYRIWCDPSFGPCLSETLGAIVIECGGTTSERGQDGSGDDYMGAAG